MGLLTFSKVSCMKTSIKSFAYVASAHIVKIASTYSDD